MPSARVEEHECKETFSNTFTLRTRVEEPYVGIQLPNTLTPSARVEDPDVTKRFSNTLTPRARVAEPYAQKELCILHNYYCTVHHDITGHVQYYSRRKLE